MFTVSIIFVYYRVKNNNKNNQGSICRGVQPLSGSSNHQVFIDPPTGLVKNTLLTPSGFTTNRVLKIIILFIS